MKRGLRALVSFLDPRTYFQIVRLLHFYHYAHVSQRGKLTLAKTARIAPNVVAVTYPDVRDSLPSGSS